MVGVHWLGAGEQGGEDADQREKPRSSPIEILTTAEFLAGWQPKGFLLKPIIEEGRLYTLTGPTGCGKTAIALLMALHVALGEPLGGRRARKADVLFLAGENPDDVRTRWLAICRQRSLDHEAVNVRFVPGAFSIEQHFEVIARHHAEQPVGLVIPDTLQAFFTGDDSNSNEQMKTLAQTFRRVAALGPAVMIPAHPVKNPSRDRNVPYGGGALLNEIDGNLSLWGPPDAVELSWCGKFRGAFEPMHFCLEVGAVPDAVDKDGEPVPTVTARVLMPDEAEARERIVDAELTRLAVAIHENPGASVQRLADACAPVVGTPGWSKTNTDRKLRALKKEGLAEVRLGRWALTPAGKRFVENAR